MTFPDNIRAIHNFYCINTNNLIECPIFAENAKTMKKTFIFTLCSLFSMTVNAQNFIDYFEDKTLRADYIFTGDAKKQEVYLDELSSLPQWAGRKHHLAELPLAGKRKEFSKPLFILLASSSLTHFWKRLENDVR